MVPLAPNPTKVMLYIAEREHLGVAMQIEQIVVNTLQGRHQEPEHLARNPFGTVPALELDDGSNLVESLAIVDHLKDKFPQQTLYTGTPEDRAKARDLERVIDLCIGGPMGAYVHATKSPLGRPTEPEKAAQYLQALPTPLDYLDLYWQLAGICLAASGSTSPTAQCSRRCSVCALSMPMFLVSGHCCAHGINAIASGPLHRAR